MQDYWPSDQVDNALAIIQAESHGRTSATNYNDNGTVDRGVMQINSAHAKLVPNLDALYDPATNIRVGVEVWRQSGWCAWVTAKQLGLCK